MSNDGIFGLEESITPEIRDGRVVVTRRLHRYNGAAAIPPGQSVEFEFYVAEFPFSVLITDSSAQIITSEISATPEVGMSAVRTRTVPQIVDVVATNNATADPGTSSASGNNSIPGLPPSIALHPLPPSEVGSAGTATSGGLQPRLDDTRLGDPARSRVLSDDPGTSGGGHAGQVARMRQIDVGNFGDLLGEHIYLPPLPPIDRVVPFEITFTLPSGLEPWVLTNPSYSQLASVPTDTVSASARIDPVFLDKGRGLWKINVKNINPDARRIDVTVISTHAFAPLRTALIPLSLLNRLMATVLHKSLPTIAMNDGQVIVQTPTHFLGLIGVDTEFSLGGLAGAIASLLDSMPTFTPILAVLESKNDLINRLINRRQMLIEIYAEKMARFPNNSNEWYSLWNKQRKVIDACNASINRVTAKNPFNAEFCIVLEGMFSDAPISLDYVGDVALIDNQFPQIALIFGQNFELTDVVSNIAIDLSPILSKVILGTAGVATVAALAALAVPVVGEILAVIGVGLALFGGYEVYNSIDDYDIEEKIRQGIRDKGPSISHFVKSSFERLSALGASAIRCDLIANGAPDGKDALQISYYDPATAIPPRPRRPMEDALGIGFDTVMVAAGEASERKRMALTFAAPRGRARAVERRVALTRETPGALPDDFDVANPQSLGLLDQHDAIVVLMMENRSFDHFFHDLAATFPDRGYSAVPADFTNAPPPGFGSPIGVTKNADIGIGNSLIFRWGDTKSLEPEHNYEHTSFQIHNGSELATNEQPSGDMNGFARDFAKESDSPQIVMSYFGMESLPIFGALTNQYPVCDNWFAALPVGTYPNRLSVLQGNVPFLHNLNLNDPSIGYLEDYSIFDLLDSQGISWKFFESDIGTLRLYDRYRLNVTNVRPLAELEKTLKDGRDTGQLPRVIFVEPEFLFGNDDHPPMNIQDGQKFIKQVIGKFIDFGQLHRVMFLITYDEHGGYFDHVPPPGTARSNQTWSGIGLYPQDPTEEPKSLGVRVPSMLLSKFASNSAKHQLLDHTSILKTILLHNRNQISTAQFSRFGNRIKHKDCAHFGQLLDLNVARTIDYAALAQAMNYHSDASWFTATPRIYEAKVGRITATHPGRVLRAIAQPRAKRYVGD